MMLHTNIKLNALGLAVSDKKICFKFLNKLGTGLVVSEKKILYDSLYKPMYNM